MKEQINKLALQSRKHADSLLGKKLPDMVWQDEYNQKFAELIVRECANYIQHFYGDIAASSIGNDIKLHFGIEE